MVASQNGQLNLIKYLTEHGAKVDAKCNNGVTLYRNTSKYLTVKLN